MNPVVVIPAYNTEKTIYAIVKACKQVCNKVIVVDNNSTDDTFTFACNAGAMVFKEKQQGQGVSTRTGWYKALKMGYDTVITLDADGQHDPKEIPTLLETMDRTKADLVIGSRFINIYDCPKYRKFGIDIINLIYNALHDNYLVDTQSCFRVYNRKALSLLKIEENGFGFSTELLIKARKLRLRIIEVPVACIYHNNLHSNSTLNPVKHGIIVAWKTLYWRLKLWN